MIDSLGQRMFAVESAVGEVKSAFEVVNANLSKLTQMQGDMTSMVSGKMDEFSGQLLNVGNIMDSHTAWLQTHAEKLALHAKAGNKVGEAVDMIEHQIGKTIADATELKSTLARTIPDAIHQVNDEFAKHQVVLVEVVDQARSEFDVLRQSLQSLSGGTGDAFNQVCKKVQEMEQIIGELRNTGGGNGGAGIVARCA